MGYTDDVLIKMLQDKEKEVKRLISSGMTDYKYQYAQGELNGMKSALKETIYKGVLEDYKDGSKK